MPLEILDGLPPIAIGAFGIALAVLYFVTRGGFSSGQRTPIGDQASTAQVAAVIVDPSALNRATAALEAQTMEMINHRKHSERATIDMIETVRELTRGVAALRDEIMRHSR